MPSGFLNRVLVTGAQGFLGANLVSALEVGGAKVTSLVRRAGAVQDDPSIVVCDLCDRERLAGILAAGNFDAIFHLAGLNGSADTISLYQTNVVGTAILLEAVRALGRPDTRLVLTGSSAEYGDCPDDPITEESPTVPVGDYGISKLAGTRMGQLQFAQTGQSTIMVRPFNLTGPGRSINLLHSDVARKIVAMEGGGVSPVLHTRNLGGYRDFVDVRDVATGLIASAEFGGPGRIYNLCSEKAVQARAVVEILVSHAKVPISIADGSEAQKIGGVDRQRGSYRRAQNAFGWAPLISLEKSLIDTLDYWRKAANSVQPAPGGQKLKVSRR